MEEGFLTAMERSDMDDCEAIARRVPPEGGIKWTRIDTDEEGLNVGYLNVAALYERRTFAAPAALIPLAG
jgi:hypothetical protein